MKDVEKRQVAERRKRSQHPGVKIKRRVLPSGVVSWRAAFEDPDTERETYITIATKHPGRPPEGLGSAEARRTWAITKSKSIVKRKMELAGGAPRETGQGVSEAVKKYFDAVAAGALDTDLRPRTRDIYKHAADKFEAWCAKNGVQTVDELTRPKLIEFREAIAAQKKRAPKRKAKRGARQETSRRRSPGSINQELRSVRTVLGYLHEKNLLTKLTYDDLRRGLKLQKSAKEAPAFLHPEECRKLLEAALRHDSATHLVTRDESKGLRLVGSTERFEPIAPFIAFCLLSGCRAGEALALRWRDVHLDTLDADGNRAGEVRLRATAVKTGAARTISLDVCPGLRAMLSAMKLQAGDDVYVFGGAEPMSRDRAEAARRRLLGEPKYGSRGRKRTKGAVREVQVSGWGAPAFSWQLLRSSCATVSANAPSIWGAAAVFISSKRLGHSVLVSERRYSGQLAVSAQAKTLEAAMGIEAQVAEIVRRTALGQSAKQTASV